MDALGLPRNSLWHTDSISSTYGLVAFGGLQTHIDFFRNWSTYGAIAVHTVYLKHRKFHLLQNVPCGMGTCSCIGASSLQAQIKDRGPQIGRLPPKISKLTLRTSLGVVLQGEGQDP